MSGQRLPNSRLAAVEGLSILRLHSTEFEATIQTLTLELAFAAVQALARRDSTRRWTTLLPGERVCLCHA